MIGEFFNGIRQLLFLGDRVERHERLHDKAENRWEQLNQRVDELSTSLVRLEERMAGWERYDRTERENLVLRLRQELADYRPQLPPPGGLQT